jgi:two-component system chemotaxis sensor kinase CheA
MSADDFFDRTEFIQYFRDETEELLQSIDSDLLRLEGFVDSGNVDAEIVASLFRALHTIKGSAGMLDFKDVQGVAHKLENVCDLLRKDRMPLSESCVNLLFEGRDILTALVHAAIDDGAAPEGVQSFIDRLDSFASVYESTAKVIEGNNLVPSGEHHDEMAPVEQHQIDAFEAEVARLLAAQNGEAPPAAPAPAPAVAAAPVSSGPVDAAAAQAAIDALLAPEPVAPAPKAAAPAAEPKPAAKPAAPPAAAAAAASTAAPAAPAPGAKAPATGGKNQTIRVDIERLDMLLNLVGELVINRTRISDIANTLSRNVNDPNHHADVVVPLAKDLADSSALLARTTNEIQESIMKVRMVPIGQVFDRFPRMVRDLAKARNKEIKLEIAGAETDLDKTIVDEVGEPLMHLVRNNVDHGIEEPDVRESRGKPRAGTIKLNAYHEGNQVIIEVQDDGGGIQLDKVRDRGIKQGLITEADRLTDREIIELIFTPGFSTAEQVTDVSGRGVGMDVVKKNILRLKGVFDVDSVLGEGTKFTMKLPLTLAIIQALLVRVANELYSIPLDAVIESQRIDTSDVRTVHGGEVITLRGQVVPLIRVGEFFNLTNERDPDKVMIVIVGLQGRQVGLVVDSFQGEQEIVIKPLSDVIGRIAGISGATILGNGSISLIIDVHSLVASAYAGGKVARAEFSGV